MIKIADVLGMLRPNGGWAIWDNDFETIRWDEGIEPVTKDELEKGFSDYDAWKAQQEAEAEAKKQALLDRLGITAEEARLLLS
jgi:hypothetical protein